MKSTLSNFLVLTCLVFGLSKLAQAEDEKFDLAKSIGLPESISIDGSLRTRYEFVDWFDAGKAGVDNKDSFSSLKSQLGVAYKQKDFKLYAQGEYDQLFDLSASAGGGPTALYRGFNQGDTNPGSLYFRQAYAQFTDIGKSGLSLLGGRFLYSSGAEVKSENATLAWLKKARIKDRLIGAFDFTFGRSFDGGRLDYENKDLGTLTVSAFHPTQGGFATDGMETITDISLLTTVFTHQYKVSEENQGELQFFYYFYDDSRSAVKTDNRALDIRQGDASTISINNYGTHAMHTAKVGSGTWDGMFWGVVQEGDWGQDHHSAHAIAVETGYRFDELYGKPWLRAGYNLGSGDRDSGDGRHTTFFQMLPTTRLYAMTPFFNMMNMQDLFIQGVWKPLEKMTFRSDVHFLSTDNAKDLFYAGAGANNRTGAFGYSGSSTNGRSSVGTLLDANVWYEINKHVGVYLYGGYLISGDLPETAFSKTSDIKYGFVELEFKL